MILIGAFNDNPIVILRGGAVFLLKRADTVPPVVLPVLDLEVLHERPVEVFVAFRQLLEVVGATVEELLAREVGGE